MSVKAQIEEILIENFAPEKIFVENQSDRHIGHAGHDGSGESHFHVTMVSDRFTDKNRVERQRMVYDTLDDLLKTRIHALSLDLTPPQSS